MQTYDKKQINNMIATAAKSVRIFCVKKNLKATLSLLRKKP